jgi:hypothetical protein
MMIWLVVASDCLKPDSHPVWEGAMIEADSHGDTRSGADDA